jgi:hypothetical protein
MLGGIFPRKADKSVEPASDRMRERLVINKEKLALASARMRERTAAIERSRKPIKVVPIRPTRWTEKLFVSGKKCESYTILELSNIMRKYGEQPAGMSKGQLCDSLKNIYLQLKNNNE